MKLALGAVILLFGHFVLGQPTDKVGQQRWVDSVLQQMTLEERVGQLFMTRAYSKDLEKDASQSLDQLEEYHVGGFCFFQGDPHRMGQLVERYQDSSAIPLLISIDAEWGLGMRFKDEGFSFPKLMTLGASADGRLSYLMGKSIAHHCRAVGAQVNFAPVVDINNNPSNPVIHYRSLGENRENVTSLANLMAQGMEDAQVLPCLKHFPGHGDTDVDSHLDLPRLAHSKERLDSLELYPYQYVLDSMRSVMIAHLHVPALDSNAHTPATLSTPIIQGLLRDSLGFEGLVFTDAMEMKGLTRYFGPGEAAILALEAGADIILLPADLPKAYKAVVDAIKSGRFPMQKLNAKVHRILRFKSHYCTPYRYDSAAVSHILHDPEALGLKREIYQKSITVLGPKSHRLPLQDFNAKTASLSMGGSQSSVFQKQLSKHLDVFSLAVPLRLGDQAQDNLMDKLKNYDRVLVDLQSLSYSPAKKFGLPPELSSFLRKLQKEKEVITIVFGTPYTLRYLESLECVVVCYEDDEVMQQVAADAVLGATPLTGTLPVQASPEYKQGDGRPRASSWRLGYAEPSAVGVNSDTLKLIDTLVAEMIADGATPGCQILIAKDGQIIWDKSYGSPRYDSPYKVTSDHLYDVASLTKIFSTTAAVMKLVDQRRLRLDDAIQDYLPHLRDKQIASLTIQELLTHHGGLPSWIAFYKNTIDTEGKSPVLLPQWYQEKQDTVFSIAIADQLYLNEKYIDSIWHRIYNTELKKRGEYRYSDLGFYLLERIVRNITGENLDQYVSREFYKPLAMSHTGYLPLKSHDLDDIVPSEIDDYYRQTTIQGYVHDMGSAMLGGVAGHAGLFSNAHDLSVFMQMLLNGGYYGGRHYLSQEIIELFTHRYAKSTRRGLGFDMKELDEDRILNMSEEASTKTFGHLGFTGTCAWADPEHQLIYIFLSNRTFPTMRNKKLLIGDYRPRLQSIIYRALQSPS